MPKKPKPKKKTAPKYPRRPVSPAPAEVPDVATPGSHVPGFTDESRPLDGVPPEPFVGYEQERKKGK
jgi:hypothetical protein